MNATTVEDSLVQYYPSVEQLFVYYDAKFFRSELQKVVTIEWSNKMKSIAGSFSFRRDDKNETHIIRLSRPLLQFCPFADTINTLLHEMIHAFLFIRNRRDRGHSEEFKEMMHHINKQGILFFSLLRKYKHNCLSQLCE